MAIMANVSLGEIINPRIECGDVNGGSGASTPDPRVDRAEVGGRRRWWHLRLGF